MPPSPQAKPHFWRQHRELISALSRRVRLFYLGLWLALAGLILMGTYVAGLARHGEQFNLTAQYLLRTLDERLLVGETVLYAMAEMMSSDNDADRARLADYADKVVQRYPFIDAIGAQPLITQEWRSSFEIEQGLLTGRPYQIRDYRHDRGAPWFKPGNWLAASPRASYIPLTQLQPEVIPRDSPWFGLDLLKDGITGPTVYRAIRSGDIEITPTFILPSGRPGIAYVKALYRNNYQPASPDDRLNNTAGILLLFTRTDALVAYPGAQPPGLRVTLQKVSSGQWQNPPPNQPLTLASLLYPVSSLTLPLERDYFPYQLQIEEHPSLGQLRPGIAIGALATSGAITYLLLLISAIRHKERTGRAASEEDLHKHREHAAVTLQAINDAVVVIDPALCVEYLNPKAEELLDIDDASAHGRPIQQVFKLRYELARQAMSHPVHECMRTRKDIDLPQNGYLERNGSPRCYVEGSVSPMFSRSGELIGVVAVFRDMAPLRQRMVEALERSEARLKQHESELARVARINTMGEMASGIAHEINQPLSAIVSYNEACLALIDDDPPDHTMLRKALQASVQQAQRAGRIIRGLREFVSRKRTQLVPVDLNQTISNVVSLASQELKEHMVFADTVLARELPLVFADTIQLEQVLLNLVRNAIEAMHNTRPWGRLAIISEAQNERVHIRVCDSGTGIPEEQLHRIFDPFVSLKDQGMGLGLTISQSIIESFGGKMTARNLPEGGAEFAFELPAMQTVSQIKEIS